MPRKVPRARIARNLVHELPLFDGACTRPTYRSARSLAVRHILRRTRCSLSTARLYAALAGFPTEGDA